MSTLDANHLELAEELRALRNWNEPPRTLDEFRKWCKHCLEALRKANEIEVRDSSYGPVWKESARLVKAAGHYALGLSDLSSLDEAQEPFRRCVHRETKSPYDAIQRFLECLRWVQSVSLVPRDESAQECRRELREPSKKALKAYQLRVMYPDVNQEQIAEMLQRMGIRAVQGQVSRWVNQVRRWRQATQAFPEVERARLRRAISIDPSDIDMGARKDGHTPRQRCTRSDD